MDVKTLVVALAATALPGAAAALAACDGAETTLEDCGNGTDDDGDGQADCLDIDCTGAPACFTSGDGDGDSDTDVDADADADTDVDADADADTDADSDADADPDGGTDGDAERLLVCDPGDGEASAVALYDSIGTCGIDRPVWSQVYWEAELPEGAELELTARTAGLEENLPSAAVVSLATDPPDRSPADVDAAFTAAGVEQGQLFLEVTTTLRCAEASSEAVLTFLSLVSYCD